MDPAGVYVLVGDLVRSRSASRRPALAKAIEAALKHITRANAPDWIAPPVTTRGLDEISAVLRRPDHAFDIVTDLNIAVWPNRFRFALARGQIDVARRSRDAAAMDGPALHLAADALARLESRHGLFAVNLPGANPASCSLLEAATDLHSALLADMAKRQVQVLSLLRRGQTQAQAAASLDITQQAVSLANRAAHIAALRHAEESIRLFLADLHAPPEKRS